MRTLRAAANAANRAARALYAADIRRFLERPYDPTKLIGLPDTPSGSPIGQDEVEPIR
ncbi:MAG: hypothetical protein R2882_11520 [Gemmatimonadales bacterium]